MITSAKSFQPERNSRLFGLFLFIIILITFNNQVNGQLSRDQLNSELRKTLERNDDSGTVAIITDNRLLIKLFVDGLVKESITAELKGNKKEALKLQNMARKAAEYFENIFSEKSLSIAVNYLTIWNKDQKKIKLIADSLYSIGTNYRLNGESEKALEVFDRVLAFCRSISDERGEAEVLGGFGALYYNNLNDYQTALNYYQEALDKRKKVDDRVLIGNTLSSIGSVYHDYLLDFPNAISYLDKAEKIRSELGDQLNLGRTIHIKASAYQKKGQPDSALMLFGRSYKLNSLAGDKVRMAQAMLHTGEIYNTLGKYPEALDYLNKSLDLYKGIKMRQQEGEVLSQIGFVYSNIGDLNSAIEKLTEAAEIMKEINSTEGLAGVYNHMGIVLYGAARYDKALEFYFKSLEIYEKNGDQQLILPVIGNIGNVYKDIKDYTRAEEYHMRGLKMCRETKSKLEEVHYLLNLANDQLLGGKLNEAKKHYDQAKELVKPFRNLDLDWRIVVGLAEYHERSGNPERAVALNDSALKILDGMLSTLQTREQKTSYMANERYVYEDIIDLLCNLNEQDKTKGYDKLAFGYSERSKSRVLLDLLSESRSDSDASGPVSYEEAQLICRSNNTVLLDYFTGDSSSCLWVISGKRQELIQLPGAKILRDQIETMRFSMLNPEKAVSVFFVNSARTLYDVLIKPAEPFLSKKSSIVVIPDGILNYLPFEVLLTEGVINNSQISFSGIPFLIKRYPISYAQSVSVLKTLMFKKSGISDSGPAAGNFLAYGDPLYEDSSYNATIKYPRLGYSGKEIENIASNFSIESTELHLRENSTEESFKNNHAINKFSYIHFASHGLIDEEKPDKSSLVLTSKRDSGEDGLLQASEIFNLKINPKLVTLSACQTGLGKLVRGEGMIGLIRAFMYAGAPSVVVSLWSVSDHSTSVLMGEFYKNLIKYNLSKTDALRKAQLALIKDPKYSHPFYWAPFILVGDWR